MAHFLACPEPACCAPAEMIDRFTLWSTSGPFELVRTYCVRRHILVVPLRRVTADTAGRALELEHPTARDSR